MDEQLPMSIRLNTVGVIQEGKYEGRYIFVRPKESSVGRSYTTYICTDTTFAFNPDVRECFDNWSEDILALECLIDQDYGDVIWDDTIEPPRFGPPDPRMQRLSARLRGRMVERACADQEVAD